MLWCKEGRRKKEVALLVGVTATACTSPCWPLLPVSWGLASDFAEGQVVAQTVLLGAEVVGVCACRESDPADDFHAVAAEPAVFGRVVGDQPQPRNAQVGEDLRTHAVEAGIDRQTLGVLASTVSRPFSWSS